MRSIQLMAVLLLVWATAVSARAELPEAEALLADLGVSASEIASVRAGEIVSRSVRTTHERDLATSFVFFVPIEPEALVEELRSGLMLSVDPNTLAHGTLSPSGSLEDFAKLALTPDGPARAKRYTKSASVTDLNLSAEEGAAFRKLGDAAPVAAVEAQLRAMLLARYQAYRAKGLAGVAPYVRIGGATRSVSDDLRVSLESLEGLKKYAPNAYSAMLRYPSDQPPGSEDRFTWVQLMAHGAPTIVLTHGLIVPDGGAYLAMQRQFYVSEGFNGEQAVAAILPAQGGSIVLYSNHTSTDQVAGFGGSAKRSIGSKLMGSELEKIFTKVQKTDR